MDEFLQEHVWSLIHWPFMAWAIVAMVIGQVMKSAVWTRQRAKSGLVWRWGYKTLPIHPVVAGALLGLAWHDPEGHGWPVVASVIYFAASGALSVWLYQVLKGLAKAHGIDLEPLPGDSQPPAGLPH